MDHLSIMQELARILRSEHEGWRGDRIENAESFLRSIKTDFPEVAEILAQDLGANGRDFSEETGLSEDRIKWVGRRLAC